MEDRSFRRLRTLVTQMASCGLSGNEIAHALTSMMAGSSALITGRTLMQDHIRQIDEPSCDAPPDHTLGHARHFLPCPRQVCLSSKTRRESGHSGSAALCHVWTAPGWQGQSSRRRAWSVQPCVRPITAVRMTAGHNARRGSGPGQNLAFDHAVALVGCPDRRIAGPALRAVRLPTFTSRRLAGAIGFTSRARWVPCSAHPWPSWPKPFARSCWQARLRPPWSAAAPTAP
jgi:hypothetical protein